MMPKTKLIISPGQALLLLIDHYKNDIAKTTELKKLYLSGVTNEATRADLSIYLSDKTLEIYEIDATPKTINNDATRRYFETHLAYRTLQYGLAKLEKKELEYHVTSFLDLLASKMVHNGPTHRELRDVFNGVFSESDNNSKKEYADYLKKIKSATIFSELSYEEREKIELIVQSVYLALKIVTAIGKKLNLPLDIYDSGYYSKDNNGRVTLLEQKSTRNRNMGVLKGHMAIPMNDLAYASEEKTYQKASDQTTFDSAQLWPKANFDQLVHPFLNSISGTMLCQLKVIGKLKSDGDCRLTESAMKMTNFFRLLISAMIFHSGGHSLYEYVTPLTLDATRKEFATVIGFEEISLESIFYVENEMAFDQALQSTIDYNSLILQRQHLLAYFNERTSNRNQEIDTNKQGLIDDITAKSYAYNERINGQLFSSRRVGSKKNQLIQTELLKVIDCIRDEEFSKSLELIGQLKTDIASRFGTKNFWGYPSESYKLITKLEQDIQAAAYKIDQLNNANLTPSSFKR